MLDMLMPRNLPERMDHMDKRIHKLTDAKSEEIVALEARVKRLEGELMALKARLGKKDVG